MQVHAVVLGLPAKLCAGRAANRVGHEGGVEGAAAPRVVHMMHRLFVKAGPPTTTEGFASIMVRLLYVTIVCWTLVCVFTIQSAAINSWSLSV